MRACTIVDVYTHVVGCASTWGEGVGKRLVLVDDIIILLVVYGLQVTYML